VAEASLEPDHQVAKHVNKENLLNNTKDFCV